MVLVTPCPHAGILLRVNVKTVSEVSTCGGEGFLRAFSVSTSPSPKTLNPKYCVTRKATTEKMDAFLVN